MVSLSSVAQYTPRSNHVPDRVDRSRLSLEVGLAEVKSEALHDDSTNDLTYVSRNAMILVHLCFS